MKSDKRLLPEFPKTRHLPYKPNAVRDDLVASVEDCAVIFTLATVYVEEKVDGANSGMMLHEGRPIIRNRSHVLNKGYLKDTPAKVQFRPIWNWFYDNKKSFAAINRMAGGPVGIYGEWLYALHGIEYDRLPEWFVAYDVYDPEEGKFLDTAKARHLLTAAGFQTTPFLHGGPIQGWEQLERFCNEASAYSGKDRREGVYVKVSDGRFVTHRFKMVRADFVQGCKWNERKITKNQLAKELPN